MTLEIAVMMILVGSTLVIFVLEILPLEVTALALTSVLLLLGYITLDEALLGLSNKAVVTVGCMFVLSHALVKTHLLEQPVRFLSHGVRHRKWLGIAILLGGVSLFSGFLNNTAVVAISIPLALNLCQQLGMSPSKVLIPLSYASIFGGTLTLIGTSTNLLVSSMAEAAGHKPLGMFEITRLGIIFLVVGLAYVLLFSRRLLPSRAGTGSLTRKYHMAPYLTELRVLKNSPLMGQSCVEADLNRIYDITILEIHRGKERYTENLRGISLQTDDVLLVRGKFDDLARIRREQGVALLSDVKLTDEELAAGGQMIAEALVTQTSSFIGRTLREIDFRSHYRAFVLALRHHHQTLRSKIAHIPLSFGDTLLILAPRERVEELRRSEDLLVLSEVEFGIKRERFWWIVVVLIPLVVVLAATGTLDIAMGSILSVAVLLILGAVRPQEAYRSVEWSVLFLIAAFVPVGLAMTKTGTAQYIADAVLSLNRVFPESLVPMTAVGLVYLLTSLMTQLISNNATAIVMVPIVLSMATSLGVDARPLLVAVCFAASAEFMTPMGYQTNMMVYGPGSYRFLDYTRFGAPLNLLFWLAATLLIPILWTL